MNSLRIVGVRAARAALVAAATLAAVSVQAASVASPPIHAPLPQYLSGGDVSLLTREEQLGQVYRDNGKPEDALSIFRDHGCNLMRLRLWVHPTGKDVYVNDLAYTVQLGRRIKRAGFYLLLDLHYSDTWVDPGKQSKPAAWAALPFDQLVAQMHDYSRDVIAAMAAGGAMPDMVQVGNEISGGMLWPDGKNWGPGHDFVKLSKLLRAGIDGIHDGCGDNPAPSIMIHIDKGGDWGGTKWFFDNLLDQNVPFDVIGLSFYPYFQGPLTGLKETMTLAAERYHKPIIVAETGYAYKDDRREPRPGVSYPKTPEGQASFLRDLTSVIRQTPEGLGRGVVYWEPEWIPVQGLRDSWYGTTLFDDQGNALPGMDALGGTAVPASR